jgi:hypothetical protein
MMPERCVLLAQAVEVEVASFVDEHAAQLTEDGRRRLVRHGHLPAREIMTGITSFRRTVMRVGPEQRPEPAENETATPPRPGRTEERTVESRRPELRSQSDVGNGAVAEHPATQVAFAVETAASD